MKRDLTEEQVAAWNSSRVEDILKDLKEGNEAKKLLSIKLEPVLSVPEKHLYWRDVTGKESNITISLNIYELYSLMLASYERGADDYY